MALPSAQSLVTLVFADIQGSTLGHQQQGAVYGDACAELHRMARAAALQHGGTYVKQLGDGFVLAFATPLPAVECASEIQTGLLGAEWHAHLPRLEVRMGIHTDENRMHDGEYTWPVSWRTSRIMDAANGKQILLSETTHALVERALHDHPTLSCHLLGAFRLKDLLRLETLYRLDVEGLALSTLPPRALPQGLHNFPVEERPFIGREQELADIGSLFRDRQAQLVTISGIGGIGKTRLAKQAVARMIDDFREGVWLVECETLTRPEEILPAICSVLSVEADDATPDRELMSFLAGKQMLLLLDCFESVAEHAGVIERLLRFAPQVRCLITSRTVLRLPREFEYELQPMAVGTTPSARRPPSDSMALFVEAASHVGPGLTLTSANRKSVHELCLAVEGLPLAIILAASQLRYLSLTELLMEVKASLLDILVRPPTPDFRHDTLQQVIADSFRRLSEPEQVLLYQLSVFSGGFYLEDARDVCKVTTSLPLLQGIARLRDNSLVKAQSQGERTRYRLLDTVREYLDRLVSERALEEDRDACRRRHAEHYALFAQQTGVRKQRGARKEGTDTLLREIGNLRAGVRFSIDHHHDALVIRFAEALARTYCEAGYLSDFEALANAAEEASHRMGRLDVVARLLGLRGSLASRRNDGEEARRLWTVQVDLSLQIGEAAAAADTLTDLANLAREVGNFAEAKQLLARSIEISQMQPHLDSIAVAHSILAEIALEEEDRAAAQEHALQARQMLEDTVDIENIIFVCITLGRLHRSLGDLSLASSLLHRAVRLSAEGAHNFALSKTLHLLGELYEQQGEQTCAAYAYVAACRALSHVTSTRKDQVAVETLDRFRRKSDGEVQGLIESLLSMSGEEILASLPHQCLPSAA